MLEHLIGPPSYLPPYYFARPLSDAENEVLVAGSFAVDHHQNALTGYGLSINILKAAGLLELADLRDGVSRYRLTEAGRRKRLDLMGVREIAGRAVTDC